jgi:fatty-acyl-CoA synthase
MLAGGRDFPPDAATTHDVANIQYTSGTTGNPKGVLLTHHNLLNNGMAISLALRATEQDRICAPVPLYHCFGSVIASMVSVVTGATLILPSAQFDALATLEAVHRERATAVYGVPTMFIAELVHPDFDSSISPACAPASWRSALPHRSHAHRRRAHALPRDDHRLRPDGVFPGDHHVARRRPHGTPRHHRGRRAGQHRSADRRSRNRRRLPIGEQGELCTRGYLVMKGYDADPEATAAVIDSEGWLHTGDLAAMRPDGYFSFRGRAKDTIIRGGENIYPREVEDFLHTHPKIADIYVIGIPDARLGETVLAWVQLKPGETATAEEIQAFCKGKIAYFKIPQYVRFVDDFPMTITKKIQKFLMREQEIRERGLEDIARQATA